VRRITNLAAVFGFIFCWSLAAFAQGAQLSGRVTDPQGAALVNADVRVVNQATRVERKTKTNSVGLYSIPFLEPGKYQVYVQAPGFSTAASQDLTLEVDQAAVFNVQLKLGQPTETITVEGGAPLINTEDASVSTVVDRTFVAAIPVNGRELTRLTLLSPGAVSQGGIAALGFNGGSMTGNDYTIDGINATRVDVPEIANGAERGAKLLTGSIDSVSEFRALTSTYSAEQGFASVAKINIDTKSGGNQFHVTAFDYLRNDVFDARNFFAQPSSPKPLLLMNDFGTSASGPIVRGKTFFFANFEGARRKIGVTGTGTVPSASFRAQILATSPALAPIVNPMPLGTTPTADPRVSIVSLNGNVYDSENTGSVRIDQDLNGGKDTIFARYSVNDTYVYGAMFGTFPTSLSTDQFQDVPTRVTNIGISEVHILGPKVINEFKTGLQRYAASVASADLPFSIPATTITGLTITPGPQQVGFSRTANSTLQFIDNVSFTSRRHTWKVGTEFRRVYVNRSAHGQERMTYTSLNDFLNNSVSSASIVPSTTGSGYRQLQMGYFAQDDFKIHPRLTLNLGIRYEYSTPFNEVHGTVQPFDPTAGVLLPPGSAWYHSSPYDIMPRLGLAWDVWGKGRTVVRAGFGFFYNPIYNTTLNNIDQNALFSTSLLRTSIPTLSFPFTQFLNSGTSPARNLTGSEPYPKDTYSAQRSLSIQQQVTSSTLLQVAYIGSETHHLPRGFNINLLDPALRRRPNPLFANITEVEWQGNANYNSMQVSLRQRVKNGLTASVAYTYSHALDDINDPGNGVSGNAPQDNRNVAAEYGNSAQDARHNASISLVYDLPFGNGRHWLTGATGGVQAALGGWQVEGLALDRTGNPFSVSLGTNTFGNGNFTNQRPNKVPGVSSVPVGGQSVSLWLNRAAFSLPAAGTFGNLGRDTEYGPAFNQFDFAVVKSFPLGESKRLQFRSEFFNVLNHPNFKAPDATWLSPTFGQIFGTVGTTTGLGTSRQLEFALRFEF
jgi:hypothetical protein